LKNQAVVAMVAMGPAPLIPAHAQRGNPMQARREEAPRGRAPPVPRAPRAAPKKQSAGAFTSEWRRAGSADPLSRRSRETSPFSNVGGSIIGSPSGDLEPLQQHRRVASLQRDRDSTENQQFEMGPRRPLSRDRRDHSRAHILGSEAEANRGMPWAAPKDEVRKEGGNAARRHQLRHEQQEADQALEWVPSSAAAAPTGGFRVNALAREEKEQFGEFLPGAARNASAAGAEGVYGKKNIMAREFTSNQSVDMPRARGGNGDVPSYQRCAKLERDNPAGCNHRLAAGGS